MAQPETLTDLGDELKATLRTREELGEDLEEEIVDSFLTSVQGAIDDRVDARVAEALRGAPKKRRFAGPSTGRIAVILCLSIPLTAIAGESAGSVGVLGMLALAAVLLLYTP